MSYLVDRKTELQFRTAATVVASGKARVIVVESRPNYAIVKLTGGKERYPISWEQIFHLAEKRHAENLRLERDAAQQLAGQEKVPSHRRQGKKSRAASPDILTRHASNGKGRRR